MKSTLFCLCAVVLGAAAQGGDTALDTTTTGSSLASNDFSQIQFILYTDSQNATYPIANAADVLSDPNFDARKPTVLYSHGFRDSNRSESVAVVRGAFLLRGSHNFILLDWSEYVKDDYISAYLSVTPVGDAVAAAVNRLVDAGLDRETFWPIGHSLGGQLSGVFAKKLDFKPYRITALDPAGPGFGLPGTPQLTRDDAVTVDVIHTDAGIYGVDYNVGAIDLWPNGGRRVQPGCPAKTDFPDGVLRCSHDRSWRFFAESVNNETAFPAVRCPSWLAFQIGLCPVNDSNVVYLGFAAPATHLTGTFFLRTGSEAPFALGADGARPAIA